ncbi:MAG: putative bifunctional diguanylate cyclase/phosphodiesterase, partial [Burkholderiaceae bacterium]
MNCLAVLDCSYNFVRVNQAYAHACGRSIGELVGHNYFEFCSSDAKLIFDEVVGTERPYIAFSSPDSVNQKAEQAGICNDWVLAPIFDAHGKIKYLTISVMGIEHSTLDATIGMAALIYQHGSDDMIVPLADNHVTAINGSFAPPTENPLSNMSWINQPLLDVALQSERLGPCQDGREPDLRVAIDALYDCTENMAHYISAFTDLDWNQVNFDPLTKLPNRYMFFDQLRQKIEICKLAGGSLSVLLIDLDAFKEINDTLGHDKGDLILVEVTKRISATLQKSVAIARLGGDEFIVILSERHDLSKTSFIAKQILAELAAPFPLGIDNIFVSASIGIALYPDHGSEPNDLLRHADQAMYAAKNAGRNQFFYFENTLEESAQSRMQLITDLRGALAGNQFEIYYQPIVEFSTGRICKAEALIRWHHPVHGEISPAEFIPLAESSGLIHEIGEWVFQRSAEQLQRLRTM